MKERHLSYSLEDTERLAQMIAERYLASECVVFLTGDLGAGKTTLVRAMAKALGADDADVSSPSFSIVHEYPVAGMPPIYHIDGYRLSAKRREWDEIGIPQLLRGPGVKFIEWPREELAPTGLHLLRIEITVLDDESRAVDLETGQE